MKREHLWPAAIVGVLAVTVLVNVAVMVVARDKDAAVIEPDYYQRAVRWDSTLADERRSADLGWRLEAGLGAVSAGGTRLDVRLVDRAGQALAGAVVRVAAVHNVEAGHVVRAVLTDDGQGAYSGLLPLGHRGLWEMRFDVSRGGGHYQVTLRRDAG